MNKDIRQILSVLRRQGFKIRLSNSGHLRVTSPGGATVTVPCTPNGGNRSIPNIRSKLRRIGAHL